MRNGSVWWFTPVVLETSCTIDVTRFPRDVQTCHFEVLEFFLNIFIEFSEFKDNK